MRLISTLILALSVLVSTAASAQLSTPTTHPGLVIAQSAGEVTAYVGNLGFSDSGFGAESAKQTITSGLPTLMPELEAPENASPETLSSAVRSWVADHASGLANRLGTYMREFGLSNAWYHYERAFPVQGQGETLSMKVTWNTPAIPGHGSSRGALRMSHPT